MKEEGESRRSIRAACGGVSLMYQYSHCLALSGGGGGVGGGGGGGDDSRAQEEGRGEHNRVTEVVI